MKVSLGATAVFATLSSATPARRQDPADTANDWDSAVCADLAVIFARGTFDSGNVGPWVGGPFHDALVAKTGSVAFQGVSSDDYTADLAGYVEDGGSQSCADSLGSAVQSYASNCPNAKIAISGWSQGALCAHKSLSSLGNASDKVFAFLTFGDPIGVWEDTVDYPALPPRAKSLSYCEQTTPDPLCTDPTEDLPTDPIEFIDRLKDIWEDVDQADMNDAQKSALGDLIMELPSQAMGELGTLTDDLVNGRIRRWMLTPEHFWYGIDGTVNTAADELVAAFEAS